MSLSKDLNDLIQNNIIDQVTAENIKNYYLNKKNQSPNKLLIAFGILGSLLIGLGIILIIAHNWDNFSRITRTIFAFIPLLIGQTVCAYTLLKHKNNTVWIEASTAFLFMAVGASISLVSQIYNIEGNLPSFILTWMLLCLPLVYIMRSSIASLLYIIGIASYAIETCYSYRNSSEEYHIWILFLAIIPHYYTLLKNKFSSNFTYFHNWLIPLFCIITLGTVADKYEFLMYLAYFALFGLISIIGNLQRFKGQKLINNGFLSLGSLGNIILLLMLSFDWYWNRLLRKNIEISEIVVSPEIIASCILIVAASLLLIKNRKTLKSHLLRPEEYTFIVFLIAHMLGYISFLSIVIINLSILAFGVIEIYRGFKKDHLGIINYGLLIITALVICRFFDTDLSFILRGLMFISVGTGFFITNHMILKRRKQKKL